MSETPSQIYKIKIAKREYTKTFWKIWNKNGEESKPVMTYVSEGIYGCCGSTTLSDFRFNRTRLEQNNDVHKEHIMRMVLRNSPTNNSIITDVTDVTDDNRIQDLILLVHPKIKPVDAYFNENSGNTVVIYSYNKTKG